MRTIRILAVAVMAAGGLALGSAQAASHMGGGGGGSHGSWSGGHGGWSGGHGGSYHGGSYHGGGYWHGGHSHGYYPYHTTVGFYFGAPWVWGPWYWGYPYDYYYPGYGAAYPSYPADPGAYPEGSMEPPAPTTEVDPNAAGAPTEAPAYMNYCVSSRAYYPKVATCPEGWKFVPTR
ncbi:MAG: hypothetical protein WA190_09285 [Usitatibacter sp.]